MLAMIQGEKHLAFIQEEEFSELRIENMILHVVGDEEFTPELVRLVEHSDFFIERIRNTDIASVFEFHPNSQTKSQLERMAVGDDTFEVGGQALAREFSRFHSGNSRDGAFFIFELHTADPDVRIYSLPSFSAVYERNGNRASIVSCRSRTMMLWSAVRRGPPREHSGCLRALARSRYSRW